jgi:hypothetical protein
VPAAGVPLKVAVPFPLLVNIRAEGNAPVSLNVGEGMPVATNVYVPAIPTTKGLGLLELGIVAGEVFGCVGPDCPPPQPARASPKRPDRNRMPGIRQDLRARCVREADSFRHPAIVSLAIIKAKSRNELETYTRTAKGEHFEFQLGGLIAINYFLKY